MSYLPPVLTGHSISGSADHTTISLAFDEEMGRGSGVVIVTDGAVQTVIDRSTGLPTLRLVGATETHQIPVSMVGIDGSQVTISADGLTPGHHYRVFIAPGVLQSNGQPFAGVSSSSLLTFTTPSDNTPPVLNQFTTDNYLLAPGKNATLTMVFSESVKVDASAIAAPNMTVTGLTGSSDGKTWYATVAPVAGIEITSSALTLDMRGVHDTANNQGSGTSAIDFQIDTKAPTVTSIALSGLSGIGSVLTNTATVTVTFSEKVNIANPSAAIVAPNASLTNVHTTDGGTTWVGTLTAPTGTTSTGNQLYVDMTQVTDLSGNAGSGTTNAPSTYDVDTQGPGFKSMVLSGGTMKIDSALTLTIELQEAVSTLDKAAIVAPNATVGNDLHTIDNGRTWIVTLTPKAGLEVSDNTLSLDMSQVRDIHNVPGVGSVNTPHAYGVDTVAPTATLALSSNKLSASSPVFVNITFSEPMKTLDKAAITVDHAAVDSVTSSDGGKTWIAKLVPTTTSGTATGNTVSLDLTKVSDLAGNSGAGSVNAPGTFDVVAATTSAPTATITLGGNQVTKHTTVGVTVVFSQPVKTLDASAFTTQSDVTVSGLSSSDGGTTWTGTLTTNANIHAVHNTLSIDMSKVQDMFGNAGSGSTNATSQYDIDTQPPTATLSLDSVHLSPTGGATLTITFSEAIALLDASWFTTPHATLSNLTSTDNITWTGTLSAAGGASNSGNQVSLDMSQVSDMMGNLASGSAATTASYDVSYPPTQGVTFGLDRAALVSGNAITVTMHFNVAVPLLDINAIKAPNAAVSGLNTSDSGLTWTATLAPQTGAVDAPSNAVSVDLSKVVDLNGSAGSGVAQSANYSVDTTVAAYVQSFAVSHDTGTSASDLVTNDTMTTLVGALNGTVGTGQHVEVIIDNNAPVTAAVSGTNWSFPQPTSSPLANGAHTISVRVVDNNGHASAPVTTNITIDTVAPSAPATPILDPSSDTGTKGDSITQHPTITGSGTESHALIKIYDLSEGPPIYVDSTQADASGNWSFAPRLGEDALYKLAATATDAAGNESAMSSALTVTQDTYAASPMDIHVANSYSSTNLFSATKTPTLTGSGLEPGATISLYAGQTYNETTLLATGVVDASGSWSLTTGTLGEGSHPISLVQTDVAGNVGYSPGFSLVIDLTAPAAPTGLSVTNGSGSGSTWTIGNTVPTLTGNGEIGATVEVLEGTTVLGHGSVDDHGNWSFALSTLALGSHHLALHQTDAAGNVSLDATMDLTVAALVAFYQPYPVF